MKRITQIFAVLVALAFSTLPAVAEKYRDQSVPITVAESFNLERYLGLWYEIARFPNRFERNCVGVTAEYGMRTDGKVSVINTCRKGSLEGKVDRIEGQATVKGPAKLRVNFVSWLPFAAGDYWVLYVDPSYSFAVVGEPKGNTGWILARDKELSAAHQRTAINVLKSNGYDTSQLVRVPQ